MSEENMVERVARALALADLDEESRRAVNLDAHMAHVRDHYEELARAALKEIVTEASKTGLFVLGGNDRASNFFRSLR